MSDAFSSPFNLRSTESAPKLLDNKISVEQSVKTRQELFKDTAIKDDAGKLRFDLVPVFALQEVVKVFNFGAKKYADRNWEKGFNYSRIYASTMRHMFSWWSGETVDKESGLNHLAHAACNILMLIEFTFSKKGTDDRVKY